MKHDVMRPGGIEATRRAVEVCQFKKEDKILDVGCGQGNTADFLTREFGLCVKGIDKDEKNIGEAKKRFNQGDFSVGDGEMLDFSSRSFDGVFMECSLSLIPNTREAIHEAYCVLKNGGRLVISDLYWKKITPEHKAAIAKIKEESLKPHKFGECQTEVRISDCVVDGAFVMEEIYDTLKELEMEIKTFEDHSDDLRTFAAEVLFEYGSFEEYIKANPSALCFDMACGLDGKEKDRNANIGYFLLVAAKK